MQKINKLTHKNFKFFYDEFPLKFERKNVLIYGENGSGKSSIYWALYTFLQSVFKNDVSQIKKYFDQKHDQNLVNRFAPDNCDSGIIVEFVDDNDYDGQPNIQHVSQKNRSFLHGIVAGLTNVPKSLQIQGGFNLNASQLQKLSTEVDKSSYHRFHSCGVQLKRGNKCFDMECVAGL